MRKRLVILLIGFFLFLLILTFPSLLQRKDMNTIVIGAKNNTECRILAEMMAILIRENTNLHIEKSLYLEGTFIAFNAIRSGSIDLYVDYTGTLLLAVLKKKPEKSTEQNFNLVKNTLLEKYNLAVLPSFGFSNAYVLIMRHDAEENTLSELRGKNLTSGFDPEFVTRPEFTDLKKCYDLSFPRYKIIDQSLLYLALVNKSIDLMDGASTDGRILKYGLKSLRDDHHCFPKYEAVPIIRKEMLEEHPELQRILEKLSGKITKSAMQEMNLAVDEGKSPEEVAKNFLKKF